MKRKKDLNEIIETKKNIFNIVINNYPETDYAQDSRYKMEYITEIMASKEMYLARYYERENGYQQLKDLKKL